MYSAPSPADLERLAQQRAADALRHRGVLNEMIDHGAALTRLLVRQAEAQVEADEAVAVPVADVAVAYERISRAMRRSVMLVQRLGEAPAEVADTRVSARRKIIRVVEDLIQREASGDAADALRAELAERLEGAELEDELGDRPVAEIITDICRDLGLGRPAPGIRPFARRRPEDVAALCDLGRAAAGWRGVVVMLGCC